MENREPKKLGRPLKRKNVVEHVIIPVEAVTEKMLRNIAYDLKSKVYDRMGTTCHHCRRKTKDQKTCCRNPGCHGIFGVFCGVCLKKYGEDVADALLNPNWRCPVCRGQCNCSACRNKRARLPPETPASWGPQHGIVDYCLVLLKEQDEIRKRRENQQLTRGPQALVGLPGSSRNERSNDCDDPENVLEGSNDGTAPVMEGNNVEDDALQHKKK